MNKIPIVIDTDAGSDDYLAIAYLLSHDTVHIEAITVVHGVSHVPYGASNLSKLLSLSKMKKIPIYTGEEQSLLNNHPFPKPWRDTADNIFTGFKINEDNKLSSVIINKIPNAVEFLSLRFQPQNQPFRLVTLGPLTNVALALRNCNETSSNKTSIIDIVLMGGAIDCPGNLEFENILSFNKYAEWNIFCDPEAAFEVFRRKDIKKIMIGLDATNSVPIYSKDLYRFNQSKLTELGKFVKHVLQLNQEYINQGTYYAWDPLVAVFLIKPQVVKLRPAEIEICLNKPEVGRTKLIKWLDSDNSTDWKSAKSDTVNLWIAVEGYNKIFNEEFFPSFYRKNLITTLLDYAYLISVVILVLATMIYSIDK
jgi:purine nucleosidase